MYKVALRPIDDTVSVPPGALLLPALLAKKLNVAMSCGGNGMCSTCHVRVREGMDELSPVGAKERRTLGLVADADADSRLACQTHVRGPGVVVELPRGMYIEKAEDLLALLGTPAPDHILHPIRGHVLIPKGKLITRTLLEQSRSLGDEVRRLKDGLLDRPDILTPAPVGRSFAATGTGAAPRPPGSAVVPPRAAADVASTPAPRGPVTTPIPAAVIAGRGSDVIRVCSDSTAHYVRPAPRPKPPPARPAPPPTSTELVDLRRTDAVSVSLAARRGLSATSLPPAPVPPAGPVVPGTGTRVGKCLLLECVGKGGLGVVYRALHTSLNISVAVKFLRAKATAGPADFLDQFRDEARLLAQLNHPNVVRVLDFEDDPALPYVVMEFVEGLSIQDLLAQTGRIRVDRAVALLLHAVSGLEAAWRLGIIHRDVKPANILVARDGTAKLVDLGLAVRVEADTGPAAVAAEGRVTGTVAYLCPERAKNPAGMDPRSDIYALGVTFFQMVTGRLPFTGANPFELMAAHACDPVPAAHEIAADVPPAASAAIRRMMAKRPEDRPQTYDEVREVLLALTGRRAEPAATA